MKGQKELCLLLLSLGLFVFDLASDCYVAVQYKRAGEDQWFKLTLTLIIVPHFVIGVMAFCQLKGRFHKDNHCFLSMLAFLLIFVRFQEEFSQWKRTYRDNCPCGEYDNECNCTNCKKHRAALNEYRKSAYRFAWISYIETYIESTPQWWLQVYVMLKKWSFPWYTVVSAMISLLFLAYSNTNLEKARLAKDGHDISNKAAALHFVSQLFVLTPRLFVMVISTYVFSDGIIFAFFISWVYTSVFLGCVTCGYTLFTVCCGDTKCCDSPIKSLKRFCRRLTLSLLLTFFVSETVLESIGFRSIFIKIFFLLMKSAENFFMTYVVMSSGDLPYRSVLEPLAWSLVGTGFFVGSLLLILRHILKRREAAVDNANTTEAQISELSPKSATNKAFDEV